MRLAGGEEMSNRMLCALEFVPCAKVTLWKCLDEKWHCRTESHVGVSSEAGRAHYAVGEN